MVFFKARPATPPTGIVSLADHALFADYRTHDPVRDKCIEMLVTALCTDTPELLSNPDELVLSTASAVEKALFAEFNGTDVKYKTKFRSKYLNLKDRTNPHLRNTLLDGSLTPARFCAMTAAEMASEERRATDLLLQETNLKNTKAAQDTSAETDQFKCGRCKQRKCKYYQLQTRSADEPMTTFVTCINCNNRWKVKLSNEFADVTNLQFLVLLNDNLINFLIEYMSEIFILECIIYPSAVFCISALLQMYTA